jgi:hypothetical protein
VAPVTVPAPLSSALADRYRLERELGQGGMAWLLSGLHQDAHKDTF